MTAAALAAIPNARVYALTISNWREKMKKLYIVETDVGTFRTYAVSAKKAISNIRFRLFGGLRGVSTEYWTVREA